MSLLWHLTLRGSLMFVLVTGLDRLLHARISARRRRLWWLLVPLAFLVAIPVPVTTDSLTTTLLRFDGAPPFRFLNASAVVPLWRGSSNGAFHSQLTLLLVTTIGFAGGAAYLLRALVRARSAWHRWGLERLSTNADWLATLEDCKGDAGITAPIGLVVSDAIAAPAILGWLRPRILLPAHLVSSLSRAQLRAVLFHELAHFRACDVPLNWLFTLVCSLHWFNPAAHLAFRAWTRFREEAADETAMAWLREPTGLSYGETLLRVLRDCQGQRAPFSALAIVESLSQLKQRLMQINNYQSKSSHSLFAAALCACLALGVFLRPVQAGSPPDDANAIASGVMLSWLQELDAGNYAQSWTEAAPLFQKAVTSAGWVATSKSVRGPLGKCLSRKLASAVHQTIAPGSTDAPAGDYVIAQFDTSFTGMKYAVETVSFEKVADGSWKADGYYIKPKL